MLDEYNQDEVAPRARFEATIAGEIDLSRYDELTSVVELYERGDDVDVHLDVSAVTFMDSTGLGILARLSRVARERGGKVTVANVDHRVEKVIRMTHLDTVIDLVPGVIDLTASQGRRHATR